MKTIQKRITVCLKKKDLENLVKIQDLLGENQSQVMARGLSLLHDFLMPVRVKLPTQGRK